MGIARVLRRVTPGKGSSGSGASSPFPAGGAIERCRTQGVRAAGEVPCGAGELRSGRGDGRRSRTGRAGCRSGPVPGIGRSGARRRLVRGFGAGWVGGPAPRNRPRRLVADLLSRQFTFCALVLTPFRKLATTSWVGSGNWRAALQARLRGVACRSSGAAPGTGVLPFRRRFGGWRAALPVRLPRPRRHSSEAASPTAPGAGGACAQWVSRAGNPDDSGNPGYLDSPAHSAESVRAWGPIGHDGRSGVTARRGRAAPPGCCQAPVSRTCTSSPLCTSRSRQVSRAVQTRRPSSSLITISYVAVDRPRCTGVATPVTRPERTPR